MSSKLNLKFSKSSEEMFLVISGISGSGKSTLGQILAEKLKLEYIDLDSFYLKDKPLVSLSNGAKVKNWDCSEALDTQRIQVSITKKHRMALL